MLNDPPEDLPETYVALGFSTFTRNTWYNSIKFDIEFL